MRIATMATGGIGGYLAVKLTNCGHDVATIARGPHLEAILKDGLTLETSSGTETVKPWIATDDPTKVGEVDAIIFGVKGDSLVPAAKASLPMLGTETVVVPFLNGVEAYDRLREILPDKNVANGMAQVSTTIAAPGVIKQTGDMAKFFFAEGDSRSSARIDALRQAINDAGAIAPETDDIERNIWSKFLLFSAVSGVTAAGRCTIADILSTPQLSALFRRVMSESEAVGRAMGVSLPPDIEEKLWELAQSLPPTLRASTSIDLEKGNPLEIEWVSGAVVRLAKKVRVNVPANEALYALLLPYKDGRSAPEK